MFFPFHEHIVHIKNNENKREKVECIATFNFASRLLCEK